MSGRNNRIKTSAFRQRCNIEQVTETQDGYGQPIVTWSDFLVNEPCQFIPQSGTENMRGRELEASIAAVFRVRKRPGYNVKMRVKFNNEFYGIKYINPVEGLDRYLELMVSSS
jgi:SPP1 family predicted phage head-tail adaptor